MILIFAKSARKSASVASKMSEEGAHDPCGSRASHRFRSSASEPEPAPGRKSTSEASVTTCTRPAASSFVSGPCFGRKASPPNLVSCAVLPSTLHCSMLNG